MSGPAAHGAPDTGAPEHGVPQHGAPDTGPARLGRVFINDFDYTCRPDGDGMVGVAAVPPQLRAPESGGVRPSALATLADVLAGTLANNLVAPRLVLTLDIDVRVLVDRVEDRLAMDARILKAGRNILTTEVEFRHEGRDELVAVSQLTFVPSPRPQDLIGVTLGERRSAGSMPVPWAEHVGARLVGPGVAEVRHTPFVVQLSGTLQGGIVALLGELAAESLLGAPVRDLQTRYLAAVRNGPGRATACDLGRGLVRVEVRDAGAGGRLAALVLARR